MNMRPIGKKPRKEVFYVKEMSDKELDRLDISKMKKLSKKEAKELLYPKKKNKSAKKKATR